MTLRDIVDQGIDFQTQYHLVRYDYDREERVELPISSHMDDEIAYIYVDDGELYIELAAY